MFDRYVADEPLEAPQQQYLLMTMMAYAFSGLIKDTLGAGDYREGIREFIRVRRFGDGIGELRLRFPPLAQSDVG